MAHKDIVSWGLIIYGFAIHGQAETCFELFDDMVTTGTYPNEIIYVAILSACSDAGNVEMGYHDLLFYEMRDRDWGGGREKVCVGVGTQTGEPEILAKSHRIKSEKNRVDKKSTTERCNGIEIDGMVHEFEVETINHGKHNEIYKMWGKETKNFRYR
ncbi:unnamed protein product [Prunus brigantina]